jgi:hypothetical protein
MKTTLLAIFLLLPLTANAWTRASDQRIAKKAAEVAPPDLKLVLDRFQAEFDRGLERAESDEGSEMHHYFVLSREGKLRQRIEQEARGVVTMLRKRDSMGNVVEHLGILAHLVADANNPFHTSDAEAHGSLARNDFEQYFERRMAKFATVFYGIDRNLQLDSYLDRMVMRSSKFAPLLHEEYFRGGEPHTSAEFDDRSTAFGVASVSYSHAVTDLANLYYYIWKEAGGDVRSAAARRETVLRNEH